MEYINVGKYVNTHGIKGEIRILSNFRHKDLVFKKDNILYIGPKKTGFTINTYRKHKDYEMVTFNGINNINEIEGLKGSLVYIDKESLDLSNRLPITADLVGYNVSLNNDSIGQIVEVMEYPANDVLVVSNKRILIPYVKDFINKIDHDKKEVNIEMEGFKYEN